MKKEILNRLAALGADVSQVKGKSLSEDLLSIKFNNFIFDEDYLDCASELVDEFYAKNESIYKKDKAKFFDELIAFFWNYREDTPADQIYLGQMFYKGIAFNPYDKAGADHEEYYDWFRNEADLSEIHEVIGKDIKEPSFVNIFGSHGFPDDYFICLQDPNPENPTIFGTDHETFFIEVENYGTLEAWLDTILTKEELLEQMKDYVENELTK